MQGILGLFSKSPFEPLYEHRLKVQECLELIKPLFVALFKGDKKELKRISDLIVKLEAEADDFKVEIRQAIPKGVFLPVNREDLLGYLKLQDNLADTAEDLTVLIGLKDLYAPDGLSCEILDFIEVVLAVCDLGSKTTEHLRALVASGFKGEEVKAVLDCVDELGLAERRADKVGHEIAKKLFTYEDEMKPSDLMLWFRILDLIGNLADYSDNTGERLRNMLTR